MVIYAFHSKRAGPSYTVIFGTTYVRARGNCNQILQADQSRLQENFHRVDRVPAVAKIVHDTNANAQSVCGS